MSGQDTAARVAAMLAEHGTAMKLKRPEVADLDVMAKRSMAARAGGDSTFSNSADTTPGTIRISNAEIVAANWPGPPVAGDIIAMADDSKEWSIEKVDTRDDSGVVIMHILYCEGT
jgi:hypothetical protein